MGDGRCNVPPKLGSALVLIPPLLVGSDSAGTLRKDIRNGWGAKRIGFNPLKKTCFVDLLGTLLLCSDPA